MEGSNVMRNLSLVDPMTFETKQPIEKIKCLSIDDLISEISVFVDRS